MSDLSESPIRLRVEESVALVTFDQPGERVNLLSRSVLEAFGAILGELESRSDLEGAIIESAKEGVFIAGADVHEIRSIESADEAAAAARQGQAVMDRVERLPFPVVAAIGGVCLGGGTELALACQGRVGSDHPRFQIGLPEVNLGILPAWGGTTRLPRLVGLQNALQVILLGRPLDARKAERMGLLDLRVADAELSVRARELVRELASGPRPKRRSGGLARWALEGNPLGRVLLFKKARQQVLNQTKGHYPAPLAALEVMDRGRASRELSFRLEAERLGELLPSAVSKNLVHLFFSSEAAKKASGLAADHEPVTIPEIACAGLLGAGTMGGGIARLLASREIPIRLKDVSPDALGAGLNAARVIFERNVKRRRLTAWELEKKMALIAPTLDWSGFRRVDVVLEAIIEDLEIKKKVLAELESKVADGCLIASNTSTLSITEMQNALRHPERMAGFHFFNPVDRMPLIEVIRGDQTDDRTAASLVALAKRLGKTPVVVKDGPGFLVNRILGPYLNEAGHLLRETGDIAGIDRALTSFGMPMGPLRLLDEVGLDVADKAGKVLERAFGDRASPDQGLHRLVEAGRLGKKTGRGFYRHEGKRSRPDADVPDRLGTERRSLESGEAVERLLSLMIAEAARCLEEGIVSSPAECDLALVMGTGFPPFRGGLLRYADGERLPTIVARLQKWSDARGPRYAVPSLLMDRAQRSRSFY